MILPYVYRLTHKETGQFYIGYRGNKKQKLYSSLDLLQYKSSSKYVKELGFLNFDIQIIAEFFKAEDAYDFEQELIEVNLKDPLCLNKYCHKSGKFNTINNVMSEECKNKIIKSLKGRMVGGLNPHFGKTHTEEVRERISNARTGRIVTDETKNKISNAHKGRKKSDETRKRMKENHPKSRKVIVNGIQFNTITEAARIIKCGRSNLSLILMGELQLNKRIWQAVYIND